ncbi:MAG: outer membrane protein [Steroidobacteraceae bacterium]
MSYCAPRLQSLLATTLLGLLTMSVFAPLAHAAQPSFEITPFVSYRAGGDFLGTAGDAVSLRSNTGLALAVNWRTADPANQYELLYSRQATDTEGSTSVPMKIEYLQLGGTTNLGEESDRVLPYAVGGLGATRFSPGINGLSQETRWSVNLGGGVRVPVTPRVRLRFELRGYLTWLEGKSDLFCDSGCALTAKGKTFFQYEVLGGASVSF